MLNFEFQIPTRLIYGRDAHKEIGALLEPYAKKVLVHYGGQSARTSGLLDQVFASLATAGISYTELGGVRPNPRLSLVYEGIDICKKEGIDLILAIGGGSVIDSAKAIGIGYYYKGDVWELYLTGEHVEETLPVATILTIPAAGSESSISSVITKDDTQQKMPYDYKVVRPLLSVINPELFFTLPKNQVANGVADMMSHIMERYFTRTRHTDVTDGLAESLMKAIMKNAFILMDDPKNYDAWFEVGFGGGIAHNNIVGVGREQDWACHLIEHELSAIYDIAHGAGLAIVTPAWMRYVYKEDIPLFVQFAVNIMGVREERDEEYVIHEGIRRLSAFFRSLGLPTTLSEVGIDESNFEIMAKKATREAYGKESILGNFRRLYWQDVVNILNDCK